AVGRNAARPGVRAAVRCGATDGGGGAEEVGAAMNRGNSGHLEGAGCPDARMHYGKKEARSDVPAARPRREGRPLQATGGCRGAPDLPRKGPWGSPLSWELDGLGTARVKPL